MNVHGGIMGNENIHELFMDGYILINLYQISMICAWIGVYWSIFTKYTWFGHGWVYIDQSLPNIHDLDMDGYILVYLYNSHLFPNALFISTSLIFLLYSCYITNQSFILVSFYYPMFGALYVASHYKLAIIKHYSFTFTLRHTNVCLIVKIKKIKKRYFWTNFMVLLHCSN